MEETTVEVILFLHKTNHLPRIAHARNKGERRIVNGTQRLPVDGYDAQTRTVYEFQGCFYHGCLDCFPNRTMRHPIHQNQTMRDVRQKTRMKIQQLTALGYRVKEMWECEWNGMQKTDPQLKAFVDKLDIVPPLDSREAFFGCRTNAIKLHHKVEENENEKIEYRDIISLYPCANLECDYPICHPEFIDQPRTTDISRYYGLIKCKILPPYELYHPVLPWRYESKLLFPLCRTCAQQNIKQALLERSDKCPHSVEERCLTGTWKTLELQNAVEKRYVIMYIYEVWHFKQKSQQLFSPYIKTFMKLKHQASGWPSECTTEDKKRKYLDDYHSLAVVATGILTSAF